MLDDGGEVALMCFMDQSGCEAVARCVPGTGVKIMNVMIKLTYNEKFSKREIVINQISSPRPDDSKRPVIILEQDEDDRASTGGRCAFGEAPPEAVAHVPDATADAAGSNTEAGDPHTP